LWCTPLVGASVEKANPTAWHSQIEVVLSEVATGVRSLDNV
jgi:hypothetical protein